MAIKSTETQITCFLTQKYRDVAHQTHNFADEDHGGLPCNV